MADITFVIGDLGSGGAQRVLTNLANTWASRNRSIEIITMAGQDHDFFPLDPSIQRTVIGGQSNSTGLVAGLLANIRRVRSLRRAIQRTQSPVVIGFIGTTNLLTILACWGLSQRVIVSERNDPKRQSLGRVWDFLRRRLYRYANVVTANSQGALETMRDYVPEDRLVWVPNLLIVPDTVTPVSFDRPVILFVGRLHRQKAVDLLLRAFAEVHPAIPEWKLTIIGKGPEEPSLRRLSDELKIDEHIEWIHEVDNPFSYYRAAQILALPSRHEGTPNVLLEAMACGLPAIVSDASPGPLEWVTHMQTGVVFRSEHTEALAEAILTLAQDADLRQRLGTAAASRVEVCSPDRVIELWEEALTLRV